MQFYPLIKEPLLGKALKIVEEYIDILTNDKAIIKHASKSLLFNKSETWMKKDSGLFEVAMGAFDGAEVCELVRNFLLHKLSEKYERKNLAVYRDDGLAIFKNINRPDSEKIKKHFCRLFINHDLELKIQCDRKVVNFLDVTLNLENLTYRPYLKDNKKIIYVNTESNNPPSITKQLLKSIHLRLSQLSANEEIFKNSVTPNIEALTKAAYKNYMQYRQNIRQNTATNKNRRRNLIWFNPPYSANVVTKVGKYVLSLLDKHFPPHNKFHKTFNRNTVKITYSYLSNMKTIINSHNHKVTNPKTITKDRTCNCVDKAKCPLSQKCLVNNIIYKTVSTSTNPHYKEKIYFGTGETMFKLRYSNHQRSFTF